MQDFRVAIRYAKSLLGLASELGKLEEVKADMEMIGSTLQENRDLQLLLKSPLVKADKKFAIFTALFAGNVDDMTISFITILNKKGRENILGAVCIKFMELYKIEKDIVTAYVKSAHPLSDNARAELNARVKETFGGDVELVEQVDESLIGGYVLRVGDQQYNQSVSHQLYKMKREFDSNPFIKEF